MAKINWGTVGERFYEAGVDRGVLYIAGIDGVPWNGLTSVIESPTGADPKAFYQDGIKYLNLAGSEEFEGTIKAYSSPSDFAVCDGTLSVANGLFVTQQIRKSFGLCYRTKIGNDIDGLDHGYKLHIVYNALASSSERDNSSFNNTPTPIELSWSITTTPPQVSSLKPSAHFIIDSRYVSSGLLSVIEGILYGTNTTESRLPTQTELITLLS